MVSAQDRKFCRRAAASTSPNGAGAPIGRNGRRRVETNPVLALAAAAVLALAASPVPSPSPGHPVARHTAAPHHTAAVAAATARPAPSPEPSNPFTLAPGPVPSALPLPQIGRTRSRAVCTALRVAVAPAVQAAMLNDKTYGDLRKGVYDYTVYGTETSRDLKLMQMDNKVQAMVKSTDELDKALASHAFDPPPGARPEDAQAMSAMRSTMRGVLEAQKVQLDAMSGFVETERMRRFGQPSESEAALRRSTGPDVNSASGGQQLGSGYSTPPPSSGFLRDTSMVFKNPPGHISLDDAHHLDRDLGDIAAFTARREDAASKVIIPATNLCK